MVVLAGWTRGLADAQPEAARSLFHVLCALEEEDRIDFVLKWTWGNIWRRLELLGEAPALGTQFVELPAERRPGALELTRIPWELTRYRGKWLADAGLGCNIPVDKPAPCLYICA